MKDREDEGITPGRRRRDDDYDDEDSRPRRSRRDDDYDDDEDPMLRRIRKNDDIGDDAGIRMLLPVGRSGWAIAAGYLGLISVLCIPSPLALIAGVLAILEMKRNPKKHGMGRAVFGIVMGGIGTIALVLFLIALAVQGLK